VGGEKLGLTVKRFAETSLQNELGSDRTGDTGGIPLVTRWDRKLFVTWGKVRKTVKISPREQNTGARAETRRGTGTVRRQEEMRIERLVARGVRSSRLESRMPRDRCK